MRDRFSNRKLDFLEKKEPNNQADILELEN